jgi:energy-coupling factor transport system permease protein
MPASYAVKTEANWLVRLDVRAKMAVSLIASVASVAMSSLPAQAALFAASFLYLISMRRTKLTLAAYGAVAAMMAVSTLCAFALIAFVPAMGKNMTAASLAVPFLRLLTTLNVLLPLAFTSRIQTILGSLRTLNLPFWLYLPAAVIIRFIPTFANDIRQVAESLKIRGWKLNPLYMTLHPLTTVRLLFTPLLFRSLKTSDELGVAAEMKGLNKPQAKSAGFAASWGRTEWLVLAGTVLVIAAAVWLQIEFPSSLKGGMR